MWLRHVGWSAALVALMTAGCNKSEPPGTGAAALSSDQPEVYVKGLIDAVGSGDSTVAWNMLPAKQQADVKSVIQEAAGKVDGEVWSKGFTSLNKLGRVLKTKKDYILGSETLSSLPPQAKEALAKNWDSIVDIVDALANSEIKTVDGLKNVDPGKFLAATGNKVLAGTIKIVENATPENSADIKAMRSAKVTLVKQEGDTATVKVEAEGSPPKETSLKKVDGKWVPAELLAGWDAGLTNVKAGLAQGAMTPDQKQSALQGLTMVDATLDKLLAAADQKAFDAELAPIAMMVPMMLPQLGGPMPGAGGPVGLGGPTPTGPGTLPTPGSLPTKTTPTLPGAPVLPGGPTLPGAPSLPGGPTLPATPK